MSKIVDEVIAANKKYASTFGAGRTWHYHPRGDLPSSLYGCAARSGQIRGSI